MEQMRQDLARAVAELQALQNQAAKGGGKGAPAAPRLLGIDARQLPRPEIFEGDDRKWKDWSVVFRSYASLAHPSLSQLMLDSEQAPKDTPILNATLEGDREVASRDLYHLLLSLTRGSALDKVVNAGVLEGAYAWRLLVDRWEPRIRSRAAGQPLELWRWNFSGDILSRIESFERACVQYGQNTGAALTDDLKVGIVVNNLDEGAVRSHLILNAERLNTWQIFGSELEQITCVMAFAAQNINDPMDVGALGLKGFGKDKTKSHIQCWKCGKKGHAAFECRSSGPPVGNGGKDKSKGKGKDKGKDKGKGCGSCKCRTCFRCGKPGHVAAECRTKVVHGLNDEDDVPGSSSNQRPDWTQNAAEPEKEMGSVEFGMGGLFLTCIEVDGYQGGREGCPRARHPNRDNGVDPCSCGECVGPDSSLDFELGVIEEESEYITVVRVLLQAVDVQVLHRVEARPVAAHALRGCRRAGTRVPLQREGMAVVKESAVRAGCSLQEGLQAFQVQRNLVPAS